MKFFKVALLGGLVGSQVAKADGVLIYPGDSKYPQRINLSTEVLVVRVKNLETVGINAQSIVNEFLQNRDLSLNPNEFVKVSPVNEGSSLNFTTLDEISVVVPVAAAAGVANKDRPAP